MKISSPPRKPSAYRLSIDSGFESLQLAPQKARFSGAHYQIQLGQALWRRKNHTLFWDTTFRHSFLRQDGDAEIRRIHFGVEGGYEHWFAKNQVSAFTSLRLGADLFNLKNVPINDQEKTSKNYVPAFAISFGAGLSFYQGVFRLSGNYQADFGLKVPQFFSENPNANFKPQSFNAQLGFDLQKLATIRQKNPSQGQPAAFVQGLRLGLLADAGYAYNVGRPEDHLNHYRGYETRSDRPMFHVAQLSLLRNCDETNPLGFYVAVDAGENTRLSSAQHSLNGNLYDIQQAWGEMCFPVAKGLRLRGGKISTFIGNEVIEARLNDFRSLSDLFVFGVPFTHAGLKAELMLTNRAVLNAALVNGWDNFWGVDSGPTGLLGFTAAPTDRFKFSLNTALGQESGAIRGLIDGIAVLTFGNFRIISNGIWGRNSDLATKQHSDWVAAYVQARHDFRWIKKRPNLLGVAARTEFFWDPQGFRTGTAQTLGGFAVSTHLQPFKSPWIPLEMQLELRQDFSNRDVFLSGSTPNGHLTTLAFGLTLYYENLLFN